MQTRSLAKFIRPRLLAALMALSAGAAWSAAPVTGVTYYDAKPQPAETITVGTVTMHYNGAVRRLDTLTTSDGTYGLTGNLRDVVVHHNTVGVATNDQQRVNLTVEKSVRGGTSELHFNAAAVRTVREALLTGAINFGVDNTFVNRDTAQQSSIERVDILFDPVTISDAQQLTQLGVPVFERGAGDTFKIAALTDSDAACANPTVGAQQLAHNYTGWSSADLATGYVTTPSQFHILTRRPANNEQEMSPVHSNDQGVRGRIFTLADLQVTNGQTLCGVALFGGDSTGADPSDRSLNPLTPESVYGLDLMAAIGLYQLDHVPQPPVAVNDAPTDPFVVGTTVSFNLLDGPGYPGINADHDPDGTLDRTSVVFVNPPANATLSDDGKTLTVPGQGEWELDDDGNVTFTPLGTFTGNPTAVDYIVRDDMGMPSNVATISVWYSNPPVAVDDAPITVYTYGTNATVDVLDNDTDPENNINPTTVVFVNPPTGGTITNNGKTLTVTGEGVWTIDPTTGEVTFAPDSGFNGNPTPVRYTVTDQTRLVSNEATITLTYGAAPVIPAVANDSGIMPLGEAVTLNVLENDPVGASPLDPTTVQLANPPTNATLSPDGKRLEVPGEGVWTVDPTTGAVTFTPEPGYTGTPTPIGYTVANEDGNRSQVATITLIVPPVAAPAVRTNEPAGSAVTLPLSAQAADGSSIDWTTTRLQLPANAPAGSTLSPDGQTLEIAGQGTWQLASDGRSVTFTPLSTFTGNPMPVSYWVQDNNGLESAPATLSITYVRAPANAVPVPVNAPLMLVMLAGLLGFAAQRGRRLRK